VEILYGAKNGIHAFGYYSTESETHLDEIWSSVSTLLRLGLADFGRNPRSSYNLRGSRFFVR